MGILPDPLAPHGINECGDSPGPRSTSWVESPVSKRNVTTRTPDHIAFCSYIKRMKAPCERPTTVNKPVSNASLVDENDGAGEFTNAWFAGATPHEDGIVKRRPGQRGPGKKPPKRSVTLRLDPHVVAKFKATGPGWQSRMNDVLKAAKLDAARSPSCLDAVPWLWGGLPLRTASWRRTTAEIMPKVLRPRLALRWASFDRTSPLRQPSGGNGGRPREALRHCAGSAS